MTDSKELYCKYIINNLSILQQRRYLIVYTHTQCAIMHLSFMQDPVESYREHAVHI